MVSLLNDQKTSVLILLKCTNIECVSNSFNDNSVVLCCIPFCAFLAVKIVV